MDRRSFLRGLLFVAAAPAIVRIDSLMRLPPPRIIKPDGYGEGLVMDMLDSHGNVIQSALLRRITEGDGKRMTSMLECDVTQHVFVTTFRLRENGVVKYWWHNGGTLLGVNDAVRFYEPDKPGSQFVRA